MRLERYVSMTSEVCAISTREMNYRGRIYERLLAFCSVVLLNVIDLQGF